MQKIARIYEAKFLLFFMQIAVLIVDYNFNPGGILEKMTSRKINGGKLMAAANSRK